MPASGGQIIPVNGVEYPVYVGHPQDFIIFIATNHAVEDTLQASGASLTYGSCARTNGLPGEVQSTRPSNNMIDMWWSGNKVASSYLNSAFQAWFRGGGNGATGVRTLGLEGFTMDWPDGGFTTGSGSRLYYLALTGDDVEIDTAEHHFTPASGTATIGFEPTVMVSPGTGGSSVSSGSLSFNPGLSTTSMGMWTGAFEGLDQHCMFMSYGLSENAYNNLNQQDYTLSRQFFYDSDLVLQTFATGAFSWSRDETHMYGGWHYPGGAWVGDYGRTHANIAGGGVIGHTGEVTPHADIDGTVTVTLPFEPVAVIFFGTADKLFTGGDLWYMGSSIGWIAKENEYQCVIATGGAQLVSMARYQSQNRSWVSDLAANASGMHAGTCEIINNDFILTTTDNSRPPNTLMYTALGMPVEAPGFFRILNR